MRSSFGVLCVCVAFAISCDDHSLAISYETQLAIDLEKIDAYLAENSVVAQQHVSGLRYVVLEQGSGDKPGPDKCIEISYTLWFLGETEPFSSAVEYRTPLSATILGWRIGLKELQQGGKMMLYVPSGLAYGAGGDRRNSDKIIPANQVLVFEVELHAMTSYNAAAGYCNPWP